MRRHHVTKAALPHMSRNDCPLWFSAAKVGRKNKSTKIIEERQSNCQFVNRLVNRLVNDLDLEHKKSSKSEWICYSFCQSSGICLL